MQVIYEDNHIIVVSKRSGEIVQGDKTGDEPLSETVKAYLKEKYQKPGNVFLGVVHRLDRPVSGLVVFARTSKALTRLNKMFAQGEVHKTYWAIVPASSHLSPLTPFSSLTGSPATSSRINPTPTTTRCPMRRRRSCAIVCWHAASAISCWR